jgi:hypothetical protein
MQIMRARAGQWPKAIAHNFLHYVTLPPDKTIAQRRDGTGLSDGTELAACEPQAPGGVYREARSGEVAAGTERNQRGKGGKPMAVLCLRRSVRLLRCSDGAGLAGFLLQAP